MQPTVNRYQLSKKFRFESAHRLTKGYKGKCRNVHGHSWNGQIDVIYEGDLNQYDMAVDYADLGKLTKAFEEKLDHKTLVHSGDSALLKYLTENGQEHVVFVENPTCEAIAKWMYAQAEDYFKDNGLRHIKMGSITIHETCTTGLIFSKQPIQPIQPMNHES